MLAKILKVWVVIPNIQFIMFLRDIVALWNIYNSKYAGSVGFYILDVYKGKPASFHEIIEKIKAIIKP